MFLRELQGSLDHIKGIGSGTARSLAGLGITSIAGLLSHYPRDWEDRSLHIPIKDFARHDHICTRAKVIAHDWFGAGRMRTLKIFISDETATAALICFNRPFLEKELAVGESIEIWGRFFFKYQEIQSTAFDARRLGEGDSFAKGDILPVYPLASGLQQGTLRRLIREALKLYGKNLEDEIPPALRETEGLLPKRTALRAIHFPSSLPELEQAKKTLVFEELFYLELLVAERALKRKRVKEAPSPLVQTPPDRSLSKLQKLLTDRLPFDLTEGQLSAIAEINGDIDSPWPMARLLQGDVGSGKTLVAFMAALREVEKGKQVAIMAPTELLARQHAETAALLLESMGLRLAFLSGNTKAGGRTKLLEALKAGEIDIVLGTHALFSKDVAYRDLGLVVVDEQHRFGVVQRSAILAKGENPGLLMMSATPIPRTLALTIYGDLDVSVIASLPSGRKVIKTHLAVQGNEQKVYDFVRRELAAGRQAYFVYPLIEATETAGGTDLKDAQGMAKALSDTFFKGFTVALVHSKLEDEEKRRVMGAFRKGEVHILVATSVVEVGVDVPNASCMVIEHAERFGLSALHQLRGRVGRGSDQAFCFLVYSKELTEDGKQRLKVMLENHDGFIIAEEDLKLRGPGEIAGIEQSGDLKLGIADPVRDRALLERARYAAFDLLERDRELSGAEGLLVASVLSRAAPFAP